MYIYIWYMYTHAYIVYGYEYSVSVRWCECVCARSCAFVSVCWCVLYVRACARACFITGNTKHMTERFCLGVLWITLKKMVVCVNWYLYMHEYIYIYICVCVCVSIDILCYYFIIACLCEMLTGVLDWWQRFCSLKVYIYMVYTCIYIHEVYIMSNYIYMKYI